MKLLNRLFKTSSSDSEAPTNEGMPEFVTLHAKGVGLQGPARVVWQKGSEAGFQLTTI